MYIYIIHIHCSFAHSYSSGEMSAHLSKCTDLSSWTLARMPEPMPKADLSFPLKPQQPGKGGEMLAPDMAGKGDSRKLWAR